MGAGSSSAVSSAGAEGSADVDGAELVVVRVEEGLGVALGVGAVVVVRGAGGVVSSSSPVGGADVPVGDAGALDPGSAGVVPWGVGVGRASLGIA